MWFEEKAAVGTADEIRAEAAGGGKPWKGTGISASAKTRRSPGGGAVPGAVRAASQRREEGDRPRARRGAGWGGRRGAGGAAPPAGTFGGGRGLRRGPAGFSGPACE